MDRARVARRVGLGGGAADVGKGAEPDRAGIEQRRRRQVGRGARRLIEAQQHEARCAVAAAGAVDLQDVRVRRVVRRRPLLGAWQRVPQLPAAAASRREGGLCPAPRRERLVGRLEERVARVVAGDGDHQVLAARLAAPDGRRPRCAAAVLKAGGASLLPDRQVDVGEIGWRRGHAAAILATALHARRLARRGIEEAAATIDHQHRS